MYYLYTSLVTRQDKQKLQYNNYNNKFKIVEPTRLEENVTFVNIMTHSK